MKLSISITVAIVSMFSFSVGYVLGDFTKAEREGALNKYQSEHFELLKSLLDMQLHYAEPYSSYGLSTLLLEGMVEKGDGYEDAVVTILVNELDERRERVMEFCHARATDSFRERCMDTVEQADTAVKKAKNTTSRSTTPPQAGAGRS